MYKVTKAAGATCPEGPLTGASSWAWCLIEAEPGWSQLEPGTPTVPQLLPALSPTGRERYLTLQILYMEPELLVAILVSCITVPTFFEKKFVMNTAEFQM